MVLVRGRCFSTKTVRGVTGPRAAADPPSRSGVSQEEAMSTANSMRSSSSDSGAEDDGSADRFEGMRPMAPYVSTYPSSPPPERSSPRPGGVRQLRVLRFVRTRGSQRTRARSTCIMGGGAAGRLAHRRRPERRKRGRASCHCLLPRRPPPSWESWRRMRADGAHWHWRRAHRPGPRRRCSKRRGP